MKLLVFNRDHPNLETEKAKVLRELWIKRISKEIPIAIYSTNPSVNSFERIKNSTVISRANTDQCNIYTGEFNLSEVYNLSNSSLYVSHMNPFSFNKVCELSKKNELFWGAYLDLNFEDLPDYLFDRLKTARIIIPQSKWAKDLLRKLPNATDHVYLGVNSEIYLPCGDSKEEIRKKFKNNLVTGNEFLITIIQENSSDSFIDQLKGIKRFVENNPDINTKVYIHTDPLGYTDIINLVRLLNLQDICIFSNPEKYRNNKYTEKDLSMIYNLSDVHLNTTPESFPTSALEAAACNVPSVYLNWGSSKEIMAPKLPNLGVKVKEFLLTPKIIKKPIADPDDIAKKLEIAASMKIKTNHLANYAKEFSWEKTARKITNILTELSK